MFPLEEGVPVVVLPPPTMPEPLVSPEPLIEPEPPVPAVSELMLDSVPEAPELSASVVVLRLVSQEPSSPAPSTTEAKNNEGFLVNIIFNGLNWFA
jgi:hypothetical protein